MKKLLITLVLLLLPSFAAAGSSIVINGPVVSAPALTCTKIIDESGNSGSSKSFDELSGQAIDYTTPITICKIVFYFYNESAASYESHVEIWSDIYAQGTQFGFDSTNQTVNSVTPTRYEYTWASNYPEPSGDYFVHVFGLGSYDTQFVVTTDVDAYVNTNFDMFRTHADQNADSAFEVWGLQ